MGEKSRKEQTFQAEGWYTTGSEKMPGLLRKMKDQPKAQEQGVRKA